jgi:2-keto-3-deoxy-L-rhamnonate aldolase RhmA
MTSGDTEAVISNPVRARIAKDEVALGLSIRVGRSGEIAEIARLTGHDFIFIDRQHALFNIETIGHLAYAALGCGVAPFVRVRSVDDPDVGVLLDNGVTGIVFPEVRTADEARRAAAAARFAPVGSRGIKGAYTRLGASVGSGQQAAARLNEHTVVVCMLESAEGVANADSIAALDGVDGIHLGSNDYLFSIGKPGQFADPSLHDAQEAVLAAARQHGKFAGCGGDRDVARQIALVGRGFRFLTTNSDIAFLSAAAGDWVSKVRNG